MLNNNLRAQMKRIKLFATDVDGILSEGTVVYGSDGSEHKSFHIQDGLGLKLLQNSGVEIAIITGRVSAMVERRARELGIRHLVQGREDKLEALEGLASELNLGISECAYAGDDLPDLAAIVAAGVGFTVADAHPVVRQNADLITKLGGGRGAVREMCELVLDAKGELQNIYQRYGNSGD